MKLVVRADDFGFTKANNDGVLKAVEEGVVTTVDLMLDTPGFEDAATRIKDYPWISVGWHTHFYWKPTADPSLIPSLLDPKTGRFKEQLGKRDDIDYNEMVLEARAQVNKCIRVMGKAPDTIDVSDNSIFGKALIAVCDEYGIAHHFAEKHTKQPHIAANAGEVLQETATIYPSDKYKDLDIYFPTDLNSLLWVHQDSAAEFLKYDPVQYYIDDPDHLADHKIAVMPWHPGYFDDFIYQIYNNPLLNAARPIDLAALCSDRMKNWIKENKVELINYRDALYGLHEYQNHLKATGSDLAMI